MAKQACPLPQSSQLIWKDKMNKPTSKYKIAIFEKCNEDQESICEIIMGHVISVGVILGQVL